MHQVKISTKLMTLLAAMALLVGGAGAATITVNGDGTADHTTIQAAINAALDGDQIIIAAGTYPESVVINKAVTLNGPNAGVSPNTGTRSTEAVINPASGRGISIDYTNGVVVIDGLTIDSIADAGFFIVERTGFAADVTIENVIITNIAGGAAINCALQGNTPYADHANMTIRDNLIDTVTGASQSGMYLQKVTGSLIVEDNVISNINYGGILLVDGFTGTVALNRNNITNTGQQGIQLAHVVNDATVSDNVVTNANTIEGSDKGGIRLYGSEFTGTVNIFGNTVSGSFNGIAVRDGQDITGKSINVYDNDLANNSNMGLYHGGTGFLNAVSNWWGDASGPYNASSNPAGSGAGVSDNVLFDPWWADAGMTVEGTNATVYNVTQTTSYTTIQAAIDAANPGDLIEAGPRTYLGSITIDKSLTLTSTDGAASTIITGDANIAVTIDADNVTLNGFTITNPLADFGVYAQDHSGIVITNNIVTNIGPTDATSGSSNSGIAVVCSASAIDGVTITGNVIHQIDGGEYTSANGIALGWSNGVHDITNTLIEDNTIYDIDSSTAAWPIGRGAYGILINHAGTSYAGKTVAPIIRNNTIDNLEGLWAHGIGLEGDTPNALVQGNVLSNLTDHKDPADAIGVFFEANGFVSSTLVTHNSFTNIDWGIAAHPTTAIGAIDAPLNWYGSADVAVVAAQIGGLEIDYSPWLASGVDADAGTPGFQGDLSNLWVGPGGSIKEAIDAVAASGTVNVAPGEYVGTEQIVVTGNIQVLGDPTDPPRLRPGFNTGSTHDSRGWWLVLEPSTLVVRDLILDGDGYNVYQGLRVTGGIEATDCVFENIIHPGYGGVALAAFGNTPAVISSCEFENIGRIGALLWADATVQDCTYTGKGPGDHIDYFLDIGGGASVTMTGCNVTNNLGVASTDGSSSAGILVTDFYGTGTVASVEDCTLTGNTTGVHVGYAAEDMSQATITGCLIANNTSHGVTSTGTVVDALGNYWGDPTGPYHPDLNPGGQGNAVSDNVLFDPYLSGVIYSSPDPLDLNIANPSDTMTVSYLGGYGPVYGYSIDVQWDETVATASGQSPLDFSRPATGSFATADLFIVQEIEPGHVRVDAAIGGGAPGITSGDLFAVEFTGVNDGDISVGITVNNISDYELPPQTDVPADDGQLRVDFVAPVVADVLIANTTLTNTNDWVKNGDTIVVTATVTDNGTLASVTCDLTAFGGGPAAQPDGSPSNGEYTWTFTPVADSGDGQVSATVTAVDNLGNSSSASDDITADNTEPQALTGLVAMPSHKFDGTTHLNQIILNWDDPTSLDVNFDRVEFRYVVEGNYPAYATGTPGSPTLPAAPAGIDQGTSAFTASGTSSEWNGMARELYAVAAFVVDKAGNVSEQNGTGDVAYATSYYLGDVYPTDNLGDGEVAILDINRLGDAYGLTSSDGTYNTYKDCNVGPTLDYTRFGIPAPDDVIGFQDLMIFAMNYGEVSPTAKTAGALGTPIFAWSPVDERTWALELVQECAGLKGINVTGDLPDGVTVTVGGGQMMGEQEAQVFLRNIDRNGLDAGMAVIGNGEGFRGTGTLLMVTTSQPVADLQITVDARGLNNEDLAAEIQETTGVDLPTVHALDQNFPNPFNPQTTIRFSLPQTEDVRLAIYNVSGRLVKTLVNDHREAGHHEVIWRGIDGQGRRVATGTYFYVIQAGDFHQVHKMSLIK